MEGSADTVNAETILNAETVRVLSKGWACNTETLTIQPDADGKIAVPADVLSIDLTDPGSPLVQRGAWLYDPTAQTYAIGEAVEATVKRALSFEDCPYQLQALIASEAAAKYQRAYGGSRVLDSFNKEHAMEARADMAAEDGDVADLNILDNPETAIYLRRNRGYGGRFL